MPRTGLEEFKEVVTDFRSITSWALGSAVVAPLADLVLKLGPPWPPGVPVITTVVEFIVLIFIFHFWFRVAYKRLSRRMIVSLVILVFSFICYFVLVSMFTYVNPASENRQVKGFVLRPDVAPLITDDYTTDDALNDGGYVASNVWAAWSVTVMRMTILITWLSVFISLSSFIGLFVMSQRRRVIRE